MSEEALNCLICGEQLLETEDGYKCINEEQHRRISEFKSIFSGAWLDHKNIAVTVRWQGKEITENPPICEFCSATPGAKEIRNQIKRSGLGFQAHFCNRLGAFNKELGKLYNKVRRKKLGLEEAFQQEELLEDKYLPKTSQESFVGTTSGSVPIDCPKCAKRMGIVQVTIRAKPETRPEAPTCEEYMALKLTREQERLLTEYFELKDVSFNAWLEGKDLKPFIETLEALKNEMAHIPYVRSAVREIRNFQADTYTVSEKLQEEIRTRPDQAFNLLKNPPTPIVRPTAKLLEREKREAQGFKRKIRRHLPFRR